MPTTKSKQARLCALLLLITCVWSVHAASPGTAADGKHAIKLFHDHCLMLRSKPDEFAKALDKVGRRLEGDEAKPFGMGEVGDIWRTLDGNYVFFRNVYSRCRMYILPSRVTDVLGAFDQMATSPPRGMTSQEIIPTNALKSVSFVWSGDGAEAVTETDMMIYPSTGKDLYPVTASWIVSATDYTGALPLVIWDQIGPGVDRSRMPPARSRSADIAIYPLDGSKEVTTWVEQNRINQQVDGYGDTWTFDPRKPDKGWSRTAKVVSKIGGPTEVHKFLAGLILTNYLNYKATTQATELALAGSGNTVQSRAEPTDDAPSAPVRKQPRK
ncbi:hypothetical protein [Lysobacter capsici]|uniref:hypothetical protein n=1 Tax=Lysobacter capsici TaxID=435897 RepID=UPI000AE669C5|nr:hypothetical protein [Lysobacter capsici]